MYVRHTSPANGRVGRPTTADPPDLVLPTNSVLFVLRPFPFTVNQTPCWCTTRTSPQRSCSCENHPTLRQFPFRTSPCLSKGGEAAQASKHRGRRPGEKDFGPDFRNQRT
jgi:hypothetical protein